MDAQRRKFLGVVVPLLILLLLGAFAYLTGLGVRDLWAPDEPRFAQIGREMLRSGDWLVPRMNDEPVALLPPMTYWLIALSSCPLGEVTEGAARLPMALAGLVGIAAVYFLGRRMFGGRAGFLGALVLGTSAQYLRRVRWLQADAPLTAAVTVTIVGIYFAVTARSQKGRHLFALLATVAAAFGILAKGPVAVILPLLTLFLFLLVTQRWRKSSETFARGFLSLALYLFGYGFLCLLIVCPWYIAAGLKGGRGFAWEILIKHNFGMFFDTWSHKRPFYYYLLQLPWGLLPWFFYLPGALADSFRRSISPEEREKRAFLLCWAGGLFVFFTLSDAKQAKYLLPLYPALALLIGRFFDRVLAGAVSDRVRKYLVDVPSIAAGAVLLLAGLILPAGSWWKRPEFFLPVTLVAVPCLIAGIVALAAVLKGRRDVVLRTWVLLMILGRLALCYGLYAKLNRYKSYRSLGEEIRRRTGAGDVVGVLGISFRQTGGIIFYADRKLRVFDWRNPKEADKVFRDFFGGPGPTLCVARARLADLAGKWAGRPLYTVLQKKVGHRNLCLLTTRPPRAAPDGARYGGTEGGRAGANEGGMR
jgi:hypothetical protein